VGGTKKSWPEQSIATERALVRKGKLWSLRGGFCPFVKTRSAKGRLKMRGKRNRQKDLGIGAQNATSFSEGAQGRVSMIGARGFLLLGGLKFSDGKVKDDQWKRGKKKKKRRGSGARARGGGQKNKRIWSGGEGKNGPPVEKRAMNPGGSEANSVYSAVHSQGRTWEGREVKHRLFFPSEKPEGKGETNHFLG